MYEPPTGDHPPPWGIRLLLIGTCTGVSFAHGSNDGQKGMGLIMLILIGIVPAAFALDMRSSHDDLVGTVAAARSRQPELQRPDLVAMMDALREQHVADARVDRIARSADVSAAAESEGSIVDDVLDPFPRDDVVLANAGFPDR